MLQELCIGELKFDGEALARREARTLERRSLLLTQSPAVDLISPAKPRRRHPLARLRRSLSARALAALGAIVVLGALLRHASWRPSPVTS